MTMQPGSAPAAVAMRGVTKRFARVVANDAVDFTVAAGEIHGLVGENGAGKSTLMKVLAGFHRLDAGTIALGGREVVLKSPRDALRHGVGMVHQHFMLIPPLTVAENVILGAEGVGPLGAVSPARAAAKIAAMSEALGLHIDPLARVEDLSVGQQQRVEILKALYRDASILILDEPTAVLAPQEADELFRVLRTLRAEGRTIILITHRLTEVLAICDRVTVMRAGQVQGVVAAADTSREQLAQLMVGRPVLLEVGKAPATPGGPVLRVQNLSVKDARGVMTVKNISFDVAAGEIFGIAGVEGNGQSELLEALTGLRRIAGGQVTMLSARVENWSPRALTAAGMSHVPEDRHRRGLVLDFSVAENLVLGRHRRRPASRGGVLDHAGLRTHAAALIEAFDIRPPDAGIAARGLSGGNQQKVVVAREFEGDAVLLVCAQPTRGVDVGAIEFIHRSIVAQRDAGRAVLLVSADLGELLSLSDRVGVMYGGRLVDIVPAHETDEREIGLLMTGASPAARMVRKVDA